MAAVASLQQLKDNWAAFQHLATSDATIQTIQAILEQNTVLLDEKKRLDTAYHLNFEKCSAALKSHADERQAHERTINELEAAKNDKANSDNNLGAAKKMLEQKIIEIGKLQSELSGMEKTVEKLKASVRKHEELAIQYKTVHQDDLKQINSIKDELDSTKAEMRSAQDKLDVLGKLTVKLHPFNPETA